ncbi:MAG: cupin domain-containing protein [Candidatus Marinimicrobia bacterium]|jgi:quercetin dioxygenase-like cupin family protein|nr:cupin domain-containing protein [Candidatus Neomarinimicrobiota bacterium]MDP6569297.1 cupin domain-containing protein [Candidatus Neomarinimicrobiota bacterium]MDP7060855.1 cupin domain-containing protein [Candidatus Neomarinimicrobiota bacterium]|tara:strand:- start:2670 stop:3149 length:480 start_codon:yes stop_codon:yes gene_type:complete
MTDYNKCNLSINALPEWLTWLKEPLELNGVGVTTFNLPAGKGYTFMHSHEEQEEVYIILSGKGIIQLEDEALNLVAGDFVRVSPPVRRAIKADNEASMAGIIVGGVTKVGYSRYKGSSSLIDDGIPDWEDLPPWCEENEKIVEINKKLKAQREAIKTAG